MTTCAANSRNLETTLQTVLPVRKKFKIQQIQQLPNSQKQFETWGQKSLHHGNLLKWIWFKWPHKLLVRFY